MPVSDYPAPPCTLQGLMDNYMVRFQLFSYLKSVKKILNFNISVWVDTNSADRDIYPKEHTVDAGDTTDVVGRSR